MVFRSRRPLFVALAAALTLTGLTLPDIAAARAHGKHHPAPAARGHRHGRAHAWVDPTIFGEPKFTAIVMDAKSGEVLYSERADSPRYPASVTKLMTMYIAFEAIAQGRAQLTDTVMVSPLAASQPPTRLGLRPGESITLDNALRAMAVHSANDMAMAVAEKIGGTESRFAEMMNLEAQRLGMTNTHYENPNGLPDSRQLSTARDLAVLTRAIIRDFPQFYYFFGQEEFTYRGRTMANTNHLLGKMPGVDGLKTGFTNAAGFNLSASAMRNGHRLIAVVMGSTSGSVRNANVEGLLLTGFDIEDRRDHGERIVATQDLFRPGSPLAARVPGRDPIDVVLTRGAAKPGALAVADSMPNRAAPAASHNWWVQVGEFRSRKAAGQQLSLVSRRYGGAFSDAHPSVEKAGRTWAARFSGFTEPNAREACSTLRSHGAPCRASNRG